MAGVKRPVDCLDADHLRSVRPLRSTRSLHEHRPDHPDCPDCPDRRPADKAVKIDVTPSPPSRVRDTLVYPLPELVLSSNRRFDPDASIVLAGLPGSGKSTLAVIACATMKRRRLVDVETAFQDRTGGVSCSSYRKTHGTQACAQLQADVLDTVLMGHRRGAVIVCGWIDRQVQLRLAELSETSPVIFVTRDTDAIQHYLRLNSVDRARGLVAASSFVYRGFTSFEFFNVTEGGGADSETSNLDSSSASASPQPPFLTLKGAERHFQKFLSFLFPAGAIPFIDTAYPLASLPTETRDFTFAVSVRLSTLVSTDLDMEQVESGTDAVELVVDSLLDADSQAGLTSEAASEISRAVGRIRRTTVVPLFYHVFLPQPTSPSPRADLYLSLVRHGLRLVPEYLSIDLRLNEPDLAAIAAIRGRTKLVGHVSWTHTASASPPPWSSDVWLGYYRKARRLGCTMVRFTRQVQRFADNFDLHHIHRGVESLGPPHLPLIAYNLGDAGRHSACNNRILTSVRPESAETIETAESTKTRTASDESPPELYTPLTAVEATRAQVAAFLHLPKKLYVIGANVGYSVSPPMHTAALAACGLPHSYAAFLTESLDRVRTLVHDPDFGGASVGLPFKVDVMRLTDALSPHARAIGAVNTLVPVRRLAPDGSVPADFLATRTRDQAGPLLALYGENTDWVGIRACLRRGLSPANAVRPASCGLVVGAGGMARAAVYAMLQLGVQNVVIYNRTPARADHLVTHFQDLLASDDFLLLSTERPSHTTFHVIRSLDDPWPKHVRLPTMIISCIPTHSVGSQTVRPIAVPPAWLDSPTGGVVLELAYWSRNTPLLQQSRREAARGWVTMDVLDLLPEQGFAQFELFTGRRAPRRVMRRGVAEAYQDQPDPVIP